MPFNHRFSRLYAEHIHQIGHLGIAVTVSKIRLKFWILNLGKMVKSCMHVDLAANHSTEGFLVVLHRFFSLRGYPSKLFSDNGSQLVAAYKELQTVIEGLDRDQLQSFLS